jgi:DNA-binding IclR family transcriptional regulator
MQRQSPPTDRVVQVLELLSSQPRDGLPLSDLARRLHLSKSTALGILGSLTRAGYLQRAEDTKTYTLGPALIGLGRAASEVFSSLTFARPEMRNLNAELGYAASLATLVDDKIVLLDRTGPFGPFDQVIKVGQRYPYTPPSGCVAGVWLDDEGIDQWLAEYPEVSMEGSLPHLRALVDSARKLGYLVERMNNVSIGALTVLAGLDSHNVPAAAIDAIQNMVSQITDRHYLARDLRRGRYFEVTFVTAPSYDADGRPDVLISVLLFRDDVTYEELTRYGEAVRAAAARVTAQSGGRDPWRGQRLPRSNVGLGAASRQ